MQNHLTTQPLLEISLLGRFQAKTDGVPVDEKCWVRRSAKSLVKLLALKPFHALHREQIMDLLWAEYEPETASNNLNKAIHSARRTLEPNLTKGCHSRFILTQKNQIILASPDSLSVDLDEFEKLANYAIRNNDLEAGQKAIELYRGDLLTEDIYEDWIFTRRESMRILFRKTATKTAELHAAQNNLAASIGILKKLIAEDATDEHIQRLLMRFYAETGSKYQALKQFEQCRAALAALGIEPEPETLRLEQNIKCGEIIPTKNGFHPAPAKSAAPIIVSSPRFTPLTFHNGLIKSANFLPDGKTIVFSAAWDGGDAELYTTRLKTSEMRRLGIKDAWVFSISSAGELAVALKSKFLHGFSSTANLAKLTPAGSVPCELSKDVQWADWHPSKNGRSSFPDARFLAVVRERNGKNCLEYPIGNVIYETGGWISHPRFSADGKKIAFIEHPLPADDGGFVVFLDLEDKIKKKQILTDNRVTIAGLAWLNDEIWFTASREAITRTINAVNLKGEERLIYRGTGRLTLRDISKSGKALVTEDSIRFHIATRHASERFERDLSWHDWTLPRDLTDDGETLLLEEAGVSGGNHFSAYIRKIDGSSTQKIGSGSALALSPDGKYALLRTNSLHNRLGLMLIGAGEMIPLKTDPSNSLIYQAYACFFPDGKRILFAANKIDGERRIYVQNIDGGNPVCLTPDEEGVEMFSSRSISPDGRQAALINAENRLSLYQTTGGASSPLKNLEKGFSLVRWAGDGENLFVRRRGEAPAVVYKYNLASGKKEKWLELMPKDTSGVNQISRILLTPDGKTYAYSYSRELSDLYLIEDLA